ncbi:MAG: hypothetical protein RIR86_2720, partial [Acidobacteriota bacterium]
DSIPAPPRQSSISRGESVGGAPAQSSPGLWERLTSLVSEVWQGWQARESTKSEASATGEKARERPRATPAPPIRASPTPAERREVVATPVTSEPLRVSRGETTGFYLEVCEKSGLLPIEGTCRTTRRRFTFGREPVNFCAPGHHR